MRSYKTNKSPLLACRIKALPSVVLCCGYSSKKANSLSTPPAAARMDDSGEIWAALNIEVLRADEGEGGGNGRSPRRPADQRHHPARFPHAKIRGDPAGYLTRIALVGGELANRSATVEELTDISIWLPQKWRWLQKCTLDREQPYPCNVCINENYRGRTHVYTSEAAGRLSPPVPVRHKHSADYQLAAASSVCKVGGRRKTGDCADGVRVGRRGTLKNKVTGINTRISVEISRATDKSLRQVWSGVVVATLLASQQREPISFLDRIFRILACCKRGGHCGRPEAFLVVIPPPPPLHSTALPDPPQIHHRQISRFLAKNILQFISGFLFDVYRLQIRYNPREKVTRGEIGWLYTVHRTSPRNEIKSLESRSQTTSAGVVVWAATPSYTSVFPSSVSFRSRTFSEDFQGHDGNTAHLARKSDEALGVRVRVARIASSLLKLGFAAPKWKGRGKREIPEKTRRPAASSSMIPTCENPEVIRPVIEPPHHCGPCAQIIKTLQVRSPLRLFCKKLGTNRIFPSHYNGQEYFSELPLYDVRDGEAVSTCRQDFVMSVFSRRAVDIPAQVTCTLYDSNNIDTVSGGWVLCRKVTSVAPSCILMTSSRRGFTDTQSPYKVLTKYYIVSDGVSCPRYRAAGRGHPLALLKNSTAWDDYAVDHHRLLQAYQTLENFYVYILGIEHGSPVPREAVTRGALKHAEAREGQVIQPSATARPLTLMKALQRPISTAAAVHVDMIRGSGGRGGGGDPPGGVAMSHAPAARMGNAQPSGDLSYRRLGLISEWFPHDRGQGGEGRRVVDGNGKRRVWKGLLEGAGITWTARAASDGLPDDRFR
ncbi:hypothetical protein PR048_025197 [Dryococelus australis]|uniref:Uncharacterized protein n=1 Tax=Dryococelus australis TaxID=614101 RepID=A0ABQ9GQS6_9NEOP|nr:hypothetical protein PR048_025197 [Dryococelus australis]